MSRITNSEHPHPVDIHVGHRVRERRILLGMSQSKLADALGITFQQVQKNEKGANRVGCSRLFDISEALGVSIPYFFEGYSRKSGSSENVGFGTQSLRLARYFGELSDSQRDAVFLFVKSLARSEVKEPPMQRAK